MKVKGGKDSTHDVNEEWFLEKTRHNNAETHHRIAKEAEEAERKLAENAEIRNQRIAATKAAIRNSTVADVSEDANSFADIMKKIRRTLFDDPDSVKNNENAIKAHLDSISAQLQALKVALELAEEEKSLCLREKDVYLREKNELETNINKMTNQIQDIYKTLIPNEIGSKLTPENALENILARLGDIEISKWSDLTNIISPNRTEILTVSMLIEGYKKLLEDFNQLKNLLNDAETTILEKNKQIVSLNEKISSIESELELTQNKLRYANTDLMNTKKDLRISQESLADTTSKLEEMKSTLDKIHLIKLKINNIISMNKYDIYGQALGVGYGVDEQKNLFVTKKDPNLTSEDQPLHVQITFPPESIPKEILENKPDEDLLLILRSELELYETQYVPYSESFTENLRKNARELRKTIVNFYNLYNFLYKLAQKNTSYAVNDLANISRFNSIESIETHVRNKIQVIILGLDEFPDDFYLKIFGYIPMDTLKRYSDKIQTAGMSVGDFTHKISGQLRGGTEELFGEFANNEGGELATRKKIRKRVKKNTRNPSSDVGNDVRVDLSKAVETIKQKRFVKVKKRKEPKTPEPQKVLQDDKSKTIKRAKRNPIADAEDAEDAFDAIVEEDNADEVTESKSTKNNKKVKKTEDSEEDEKKDKKKDSDDETDTDEETNSDEEGFTGGISYD